MKRILEKIENALGTHYAKSEVNALARIIATELLAIPQTTFFLKDDVALTPGDEQRLCDALERLKNDEPIQYILGYSDFCELRFAVTPDVLIPRPETQELVEWIAGEAAGNERILDIGTGSGSIAITLAHKLPNATVAAWDISGKALNIARANSKANNCNNVKFEERDILAHTPATEEYDIIVSNPPYIKECEKEGMHKNVLQWEPHLALFVPDNDPLLFYRAIAEKAKKMLAPGGRIYFEINRAHGEETVQMLSGMGYKEVVLRKDFAENNRMIRAIKG